MSKDFRTYLLCLMAMGFAASSALSDTLVVGSSRYEGTFLSYKNNSFTFLLKDGKSMVKTRTFLKALELSRPLKVSYLERGKKKVENVDFQGYEKFKFVFSSNGKKVYVNGSSLKEIELPQIQSEESSDMFHIENAPKVIPPVKFSGLDDADLTAEQQSVIDGYKEVRAEYELYIDESTALVTKLESAKGTKREQILNQLRARKQDEQPIKEALRAATANLLTVFPPSK